MIDHIGKKYWCLTAIKHIRFVYGKTKHHIIKNLWLFKCDCGNLKEINIYQVVFGGTKSCGCLKREANLCTNIKKHKPFGVSSFNTTLAGYIWTAKKRKLEFSLTTDQFRNITSSNCYYCGCIPANKRKVAIKRGNFYGDYLYNGIDRLDNSKGYTVENSVPCCKICNYMKQKLGIKEFLEHIEKIYKFKIECLK